MSTENKFEEWALVELMGRQRIVGKVSEATLAGGAFLRVDVPEVETEKGFTRYFAPGAIYAISPVQEDVARALLRTCRPRPVERYELPAIAEKVTRGEDVDGDPYV